MTYLLIVFVGTAGLLWLSVFGYLAVLRSVAARRRDALPRLSACPDIAVVIPTLNEERLIQSKLTDLQRTDYPRERIAVMVVDGGSHDHTATLVQQAIDRGAALQLLRVDSAGSKMDQINRALALLTQEIVVVTDVDSVLDPACIRELVRVLVHDPATALVGATVRPDSPLLEERLHWWFLNHLWWLEGEALSAAVVSGVCYALRRAAVLPLVGQAQAEDVQLALVASGRGLRVRICRAAHATEVRVPQSAHDLLQFRRRRGAGYVLELLRSSATATEAPVGWRLVRHMRLWHFLVTPKLGAAVALAGAVLLCTPHWRWAVLTLAAFVAPALAVLFVARTLASGGRDWWQLGIAASRLLGLTWIALLTLPRHPEATPEES
jgi:cellulose synthase/poly-beta-1,6-N-acetylglucosamine synthase-like glycosyltransferase